MAPAAQWEFGSSPIIHDGKVIVQADVQKGSFLGAFDVKTGKELWRTPRTMCRHGARRPFTMSAARTQVLVNGWRHMADTTSTTGEELWRIKSVGGDIPVPTPVVGHGMVYHHQRPWPGSAGVRRSRYRQGRLTSALRRRHRTRTSPGAIPATALT